MDAGGWFSFSVPRGVAGVAAGLNSADTTTDPSEIQHGLVFSAGQFYVSELGVRRTADASYADGEVFHVLRSTAGNVFYCRGTQQTVKSGVVLPGTLVYASTVPSTGSVVLDASLLTDGDRIDGLTYIAEPDGGVVDVAFEPLQTAVADAYYGSAIVRMEPLAVLSDVRGGADLRMQPLLAQAADDDYAQVVVALQPLSATVQAGAPITEIVQVSLPALSFYADAGDQTEPTIDVSLPALQTLAADDDYAQVNVTMRPLATYAQADLTDVGNYFRIYLPAISSNAIANDSATSAAVVDVAVATDAVFGEIVALLESAAAGSDATLPSIHRMRVLEDAAKGSDAALASTQIPVVEDTLAAADEYATGVIVLAVDALLAAEEVAPTGMTKVLMAEAFAASDAAAVDVQAMVEDVFLGADLVLPEDMLALEDGMVAADEQIIGSEEGMLLQDSAGLSDATELTMVSAATLIDAAVGSEQLIARTPGLVAWVLNTESGGVCWYDNWGFTGMASAAGKVFAVGPDGLMVLGGGTDAGATIKAEVQYGLTDFGGYDQDGHPKGNAFKKRIAQYWFDYYSKGTLEIFVETYGENFPGYTYTMPMRAAASPRNGRIEPGKGLVARYWRLAVRNTAGADFTVNNIAADTLQSTRKL